MQESQLQRLVEVMDTLRSPGGCPWDAEQTHESLLKYLLEESKRLREAVKNAAKNGPTETLAVVVEMPKPAPVAAVHSPATPALSSAEQRKQDAQRRQQLAAQTRPLKKELEQIEQRMAGIETEKSALEHLLSRPIPAAEIADAGRKLKALGDEFSAMEERWLELTQLLEETA